ncbi:MAG: ABC transporter substrate-binding protein, partial [Nitrospirota bacterium]
MKIKLLFLCACMFLLSCSGDTRLDGYLYLRLNANPTTLDPAFIVDVTGGNISAKIFNGLVRFDERLNIIPDIAGSWYISKDGRVYTFKLKKGVRFANGREVEAGDFKYSFERILNPGTRSPNTWVLEAILGAKEYMNGKIAEVSGIKVIDRYTLRLITREPFMPFMGLLAMTAAYVVPKEEIERLGAEFSRYPSGTGPFKISEWRQSQWLRLVVNDSYFEGRAKIKGIIYRIIPEDLTAIAEFETGRLDAIGIPASEFRRYMSDNRWKDKILSGVGMNTYYLGLNCSRRPFDNPVVRRAVAYAIDRKKILDTVYQGRGQLAESVIPPMLLRIRSSEFRVRSYKYDPEMARRLLKEAGYPEGLRIKIYITADQEVLDIVEVIQHYLKEAGIYAEIRSLEWSAYKEALNKGEPDAFWLSWWADYPDPENFLFPVFHSSNWGAAGNRTRFKNTEVDKLIEKAQKAVDVKMRYKLYRDAELRIIEQVPWVFFWHRIEYVM